MVSTIERGSTAVDSAALPFLDTVHVSIVSRFWREGLAGQTIAWVMIDKTLVATISHVLCLLVGPSS